MKRVIVILLAVVLVAGGFGGFAYAKDNSLEPMTGQKLVGIGYYGTVVGSDMHTMFVFTNPDSVGEITVDRVSIFTFDGTILYEGLLLDNNPYWGPHFVNAVELHDYIEPQDPLMPVTVEIFWSGAKEGLPLAGWQFTAMSKQDSNGNVIEATTTESQMVNMEQVLEPEKEKVTTLRLQTWRELDDPLLQPLENFAQTVEDGTKSLVQVELYPSASIREIAEAVRQGDVEMGLMHSSLLQDSPSVMDTPQLPFLFNDGDGLMAAIQAGIGDLMDEALQEPNITTLGWTTTGFSHLLNRQVIEDDQMVLDHPIIQPDDLIYPNGEGLKIRVPGIDGEPGGMQWEAITEWGGNSITAPLVEVYMLLENEDIDGAALSLQLYDVLKLYELDELAPQYFCVDYAFGNLEGLCINSEVWDSLDKKTRQIITQAADEFAIEMLEAVRQVEEEALEKIEDYGVEVYTLSPEERAVWRQASLPIWQRWLDELGDLQPVGEEIIAIALAHNPLP